MNLETDDIFALLVSPPFSSILYPWREPGMPPGNHFFVHGDHICTITLLTIHRFKGLDLIDRVPEELWTEVHGTVQEAVIRTITKKKKCKNAKWLSEEALQRDTEQCPRQRHGACPLEYSRNQVPGTWEVPGNVSCWYFNC